MAQRQTHNGQPHTATDKRGPGICRASLQRWRCCHRHKVHPPPSAQCLSQIRNAFFFFLKAEHGERERKNKIHTTPKKFKQKNKNKNTNHQDHLQCNNGKITVLLFWTHLKRVAPRQAYCKQLTLFSTASVQHTCVVYPPQWLSHSLQRC